MDLTSQAQQLTPEQVAALVRRNLELEAEAKVRRRETAFFKNELEKREQLEGHVEQLQSQVLTYQREVEELKDKLEWYQRQLFGAKSERQILEALTDSQQLWLGEQMLELPEEPPKDDESVQELEGRLRGRKRQKKSKPNRCEESESSRLHFDESVPIEEVVIEDPELESLPEDQVQIIGEEITYKLAQRSPYVVIKTVRKSWKKKGSEDIHRAGLPVVIERSIADVSFLAGLTVDKHFHHLPLHRQHQRLEQSGIFIERSTLTRLIHRVAQMCELVYQAQLSSILQSSVITMDESPTPAGRLNKKMKKGFYWVLYGDKDEVAFVYSPTRARKVIDKLLENFEGTLLSDGYRAYESFHKKNPDVIWATCWAHTRRKFFEAMNVEPEKVKAILKRFQDLYDIEEEARGDPEALARLRDEKSRKIVDELFIYFEKELAETALLPSNRFVKALEYALKLETPLRMFLEDPEIPIDTNHAERMIRPAVIGRKNWMFHTTEDGARNSGILYTLLQTCYLHDVNPRTYMIDLLQRMDTHPGKQTWQLIPREWKERFATNPIPSLLDR